MTVIPPINYGKGAKGRPRKYNFESLKKYGDSVFFEEDTGARRCAAIYAERNGIKVTSRKEGEGVRIYHAGKA